MRRWSGLRTLLYWRTSVVICCTVYRARLPCRQNWVSSMSCPPVVHSANPYSRWKNSPRLCSHRSGAAQTLLLSLIFLLQLQHYFFRISIPFIFHPHLSPLFLTLFFFIHFESPSSLPLPYTSLSLFWLQNVSLSLYLDALLSPWFLFLYLTSFFFSVEGQICESAQRFISVV